MQFKTAAISKQHWQVVYGQISKKYHAIFAVGAFIATVTTACTDAMYGSVTRFNKETEIMCYSGSSTPVFVDRSTGKGNTVSTVAVFIIKVKTLVSSQVYMDQ